MSKSNKHVVLAAVAAFVMLAAMVGALYATDLEDYTKYDHPVQIEFDQGATSSSELSENSFNYVLLEKYGPVLLVLGILMFAAMLGGVCVSKEDIAEQQDLAVVSDLQDKRYLEEGKK